MSVFSLKARRAGSSLSRRDFIKFGTVAAAAVMTPIRAFSALDAQVQATRELNLYNLHTHEHLEVCYCRDGQYDPQALKRINHILRDFRNGQVKPIDVRLLDLLHDLSAKLPSPEAFHVISGYRSPATNALLRRRSRRVASKSMHLLGKAIDIRLPGVATNRLRDSAVALEAGGVGFYPGSDFVHVDVGRVRHW